MTTHISSQPKQFIAAKVSQQHCNSLIQLLAAVAAFWPIWFWYCERISDRSDEPLGILALITVIALSWGRLTCSEAKTETIPSDNPSHSPENNCRGDAWRRAGQEGSDQRMDGIARNTDEHETHAKSSLLWSAGWQPAPDFVRNLPARALSYLPILLVVLYCCLIPHAPLVVQSVIAVAVVAILLIRAGATRFPLAGNWILLLLSLPIVASLNFYFGYPLRFLASCLASVLLNLGGLAVRVQGAAIFWNDTDVSIDQPCSGIRMLWVALYLSATLSSMLRLKVHHAIQLLLLAMVSAVVANALRVSSLFYLESGIIKIDAPWHSVVHSGIGVVAFALTAVVLTVFAFALSSATTTVSPRSFNPDTSTTRTTPARAQLVAFMLCCSLAATLPFFVGRMQDTADLRSFKGWPTQFEGRPLHEQKLSNALAQFADQFPGCMAVFASDERRIIFRWVTQPTRQLHPAETCYRASGYEIKWLPQYQDSDGHAWAAFEATKNSEKLSVRERIFDESGHAWTDVSAWYWSAVLQHSHAPWWSVSVVQPIDSDRRLVQPD